MHSSGTIYGRLLTVISVFVILSILYMITNLADQDTPTSDLVHYNAQGSRATIHVRNRIDVFDAKNSTDNMTKDRTKSIHPPLGTQMGEKQIAAIRKVIPEGGNLLVWGLGNDSPFWHDITRGKVVFLEHEGQWYVKITQKYPYLEAYKVKYRTNLVESYDKYINHSEIWPDLDLRPQLPHIVIQTSWHVIIVDAPPGYSSQVPGRFQSIYTSSLLARNGTHIYVDDYDRKVERDFSLQMLHGQPVEVVNRLRQGFVPANKQAHFIQR